MRLLRLVFAAILNATVPSPLPLAPEVIVIHAAFATAVHEQPASVSTLTLLLVAAAGTEALTGEIEKVQVWPA